VGARAAGTHGTPGAALRQEVGARATVTCGGPGATLSREVGAGAVAVATRGSPGPALSRGRVPLHHPLFHALLRAVRA
jgi:hypothetical protein